MAQDKSKKGKVRLKIGARTLHRLELSVRDGLANSGMAGTHPRPPGPPAEPPSDEPIEIETDVQSAMQLNALLRRGMVHAKIMSPQHSDDVQKALEKKPK